MRGLQCFPVISLDCCELEQVTQRIPAKETWPVGNRLCWNNRCTRFTQPAPVIFQVINYEANMTLVCHVGWIGVGQEVQFHFALPGGEPDEIEMAKGARRLFFL